MWVLVLDVLAGRRVWAVVNFNFISLLQNVNQESSRHKKVSISNYIKIPTHKILKEQFLLYRKDAGVGFECWCLPVVRGGGWLGG